MKKKMLALFMAMMMVGITVGCGSTGTTKKDAAGETTQDATADGTTQDMTDATTQDAADDVQPEKHEDVTIMIAAAASLENCYTQELIPMFEEQYPYITVTGTYDSSGKLQTQIEEGLEADVFMSAATKQMNALKEEGLVDGDSIVELLENKLVLIVPAGMEDGAVTEFADIVNAGMIAIGDPESVPAGQYAKEAFTNLGIWDEVSQKASLGTNVTEVLNWVAAGSADAGVVYATDAASTADVTVIAEAPEGSMETPVIYPVGIVSASTHKEEAGLFIDFLQREEAIQVFEDYGFTNNLN